jgi:hypothetical protein
MSSYLITSPSKVCLASFGGDGQLLQEDVTRAIPPPGGSYSEIDEPKGIVHAVHDPVSVEGGLVYSYDGVKKTVKECFWECMGGAPGVVAGAGGAAIASGSIPKRLVGLPHYPGSSPFTSVGSIVVHKNPKLAKIPIPKWIPNKAPIINPTRMPPVRMVRTAGGLIRFVDRWIPGIGWGLLAADLIILDQCIAKCRDEPSFLMQLLQETILPKPAY